MEKSPRPAAADSGRPPYQVGKSFSDKHGKKRDRPSRWDDSFKKGRGNNGLGFFSRGKEKFRNSDKGAERGHSGAAAASAGGGGGVAAGGDGELNHFGMLVVNQIVMLDGSIRTYYSLPPDYPMPPDFRLVFPPEFAPVGDGIWASSGSGDGYAAAAAPPVGFPDGGGWIVETGYQPQFVVGAAENGYGGGGAGGGGRHDHQPHQRRGGGNGSHRGRGRRSHWNRQK